MKGKRGQPLTDHARVMHPDRKFGIHDFKMEITGQYNRVLPRIVKEEVKAKVNILNSKTNFHQARIVRLVSQDQASNLLD